MEKILVPVDGSASCLNAVKVAAQIAQTMSDAHIHLLNVQEPPPAQVMIEAGIPPESWQASQEEAGRKALAAACRALDEAKRPYTAEVSIGHPAERIAARAQELGCGRIVMGTRGMGAFANLVLGSVAMRVVHAVSCPVTLVH